MKTKRNPYTPGEGIYPACLAGREEELATLRAALETVAGGDPVRAQILYGPRGNGKTVLLEALWREATEGITERPAVRALDLTGAPDGLLVGKRFAGKSGSKAGAPVRHRAEIGASLEGFGRVSAALERERGAETPRRRFVAEDLPQVFEKPRPTLVLLDEAQAADPGELGIFLKQAQNMRRGGYPLLVVLAGTPELEFVLRGLEPLGEPERRKEGAKATFWTRGEPIPVGRLPEGGVARILEETGEGAGLRYAPAALERLVAAACRYPYFAQELGSAAWKAAGDEGTVDAACAARALGAFEERKTKFYAQFLKELKESGLARVSCAVAEALEEAGGALDWLELDRTIEAEAGSARAVEARERLAGIGFVWEAEPLVWKGGVASLVETVRCTFAAEATPTLSADPGL